MHTFKIRHLRDSFAFLIILVKIKNFFEKSLDQRPLGAVVFGKLAEKNVLLKLALFPFFGLMLLLVRSDS